MTKATTTYSAIKPSVSNMSNIRKSVANIQHTRHIRSAIAAILITYDKHPLIIVCFYQGTIYMLTLQLKTTRIILINNLNNLIQQLARQSTPCRAQGISCKYHQVYKSPYLFRSLFQVLCDELDKLARQCQAVNSHLQISESCTIDFYTGTNQVLMSDNPESQRFLEIFLDGIEQIFHCYYK